MRPSPGRLEMPCIDLERLIQAAFGTFGDGAAVNAQPLHIEVAAGQDLRAVSTASFVCFNRSVSAASDCLSAQNTALYQGQIRQPYRTGSGEVTAESAGR